ILLLYCLEPSDADHHCLKA
ncbi:hypothetical protein NPIL_444251, partial [Nephila pilipes]